MTYMMIVPVSDLADGRPRVVTKFFEAASDAAAVEFVDDAARDVRVLMDLAVCGWRNDKVWKELDGKPLLKEAGYAFGNVEVWSGEHLLHVAATDFGAFDLDR
jgi:hypothetical protein